MMDVYDLEKLQELLGDQYDDVDIIIVVGCRFEEDGDEGLRGIKPVMIQHFATKAEGGLRREDGGTLLMMAGQLLQDDETN